MIDEAQPGLIGTVERVSRQIAARLAATPGARPLPKHDWIGEARAAGTLRRPLFWTNDLVTLPSIRHAHVEFFGIPDEIGILHVCLFPGLGTSLPIFGFDVIAGRDKATGCFLDLSPTVPRSSSLITAWAERIAATRPALGEPRPLPDWATVFSADAIAVRPRSAAELQRALEVGNESLLAFLDEPASQSACHDAMRVAQQAYVDAQRRNDRTRRMLAACVGDALAERFIRTCLFPDPPRDEPR